MWLFILICVQWGMKNASHDALTDPALTFPLRKGQQALYLIFVTDEETASRVVQLADQLGPRVCWNAMWIYCNFSLLILCIYIYRYIYIYTYKVLVLYTQLIIQISYFTDWNPLFVFYTLELASSMWSHMSRWAWSRNDTELAHNWLFAWVWCITGRCKAAGGESSQLHRQPLCLLAKGLQDPYPSAPWPQTSSWSMVLGYLQLCIDAAKAELGGWLHEETWHLDKEVIHCTFANVMRIFSICLLCFSASECFLWIVWNLGFFSGRDT